MQADDVARLEQRVEGFDPPRMRAERIIGRERIKRDRRHADRCRHRGQRPPDHADADEAERAAAQFVPLVALLLPATVADEGVLVPDVLDQCLISINACSATEWALAPTAARTGMPRA